MDTLKKLEAILDVPSKAKARILAELRSHCEETRDELIEAGATPEEAGREACNRLGPPERLAGDFLRIYGPGWKTFVLILFPFLMALLGRFHRGLIGGTWFATTVDSLLVLTCLMILAGTVWAVVRSKKAPWSSTWLAGSILAFSWLEERFNVAMGGTVRLDQGIWFVLPLLPATLNLWFYRAKSSQRWCVFALWLTLLLYVLFFPRWSVGPFSAVEIVALDLRWLLHAAAWILLAAALAPAGRGNWALYSSLSAFVYLINPVWWYWDPVMNLRFWVAAAIGPVAIWVLLYSRKSWMKTAVLASAVLLIGYMTASFHLRVRLDGVWLASYAVLAILRPALDAVVVVAPLLIWDRRNRAVSAASFAERPGPCR